MLDLRSTLPLAVAATAFAAGLSACGDDDPTPPPANNAPTAALSVDPEEVPRNDGNQTVVTLDGSASSDPDGDALSYSWTVAGGTFENGTAATDPIAQVSFPGTGNYDVTLQVADGNGGADQAAGVVLVANQAPVATATADPDSVPSGDGNATIVTLDASGSTDPDGDALTFAWTVPSGTFENGTAATDETPEVSFPGSGDYETTVVVTDLFGAADTATVTVFLIP